MISPAEVIERTLSWEEEADMLLSLLNCVVPEHQAVYASSEVFTGQRFYDLCTDNEVRTADELEKRLGPEYKTTLLAKNIEKGMNFAKSLREHGHQTVLAPVAFNAKALKSGRNWSDRQYRDFWGLVIAKKCNVVYMNEGWQFSEACVFDYLSGVKAGKKVLNHVGNYLVLDAARKLVTSSIWRLQDLGFDVSNLHEGLAVFKSFSTLG